MGRFIKVQVVTGSHGAAQFREDEVDFPEGTPQSMLTKLTPGGGYQLRYSPIGYRSQVHCTSSPRWAFVLQGKMEVGLLDGSSRIFGPGEHCYFADMVPEGQVFDPAVHGHWSRQVGDEELVTLFVRD